MSCKYLRLCIPRLSSVVVLIGAQLGSLQQSDPLNPTSKNNSLSVYPTAHSGAQKEKDICREGCNEKDSLRCTNTQTEELSELVKRLRHGAEILKSRRWEK